LVTLALAAAAIGASCTPITASITTVAAGGLALFPR
jgi:hypothetical protein